MTILNAVVIFQCPACGGDVPLFAIGRVVICPTCKRTESRIVQIRNTMSIGTSKPPRGWRWRCGGSGRVVSVRTRTPRTLAGRFLIQFGWKVILNSCGDPMRFY